MWGAAPAISTAKSSSLCFGNGGSVKLTVAVDDRSIILLVNRKVVYLAAVAANIAFDTRVFLKRNTRENLNTQITGTALSDL